jgi:8-oxo-dGTP diphosphatase
MHKDVALIFFYKDDQILVQDRRNMSKFGEEWGFFGGRIEAGETPEQAVVRETKEELAYELKDFVFIKKSNHQLPGVTFTVYAFAAPLPALNSFNQKEGQGMKVVSEKEIVKLKFNKPDYEIIKYVFEFLRARENKLGK